MPRKMSAAAALRARAELAANAAPKTLPASFLHWLNNDYKPQPDLQPVWPEPLNAFVVDVLSRSNLTGEESLRKHVTHLVHYGAWRIKRHLSLDAVAAMNRPDVDTYTRDGMAGSSEKSQSDRRSRLRRICDTLNPDNAPNDVTIPRPDIKPPYPADLMTRYGRAVLTQPTAELTRQVALAFGLGAGAGIDSPELKLLDTSHITDHGEHGISIDVPGPRARRVWVLREYEGHVRRGLQGLKPGQPLIGKVKTRRNVAAAIYTAGCFTGGLPAPEQSRLRTTWIATLMCRPVPLRTLLDAAGLKSTRTLFDILPHLPADDTDTATALRDGNRS
jgi:hypothetical protein